MYMNICIYIHILGVNTPSKHTTHTHTHSHPHSHTHTHTHFLSLSLSRSLALSLSLSRSLSLSLTHTHKRTHTPSKHQSKSQKILPPPPPLPFQDLGDLYEKILWARRHDSHAQMMSERLVQQARQTLTQTSVVQYVHMLLVRLMFRWVCVYVCVCVCVRERESERESCFLSGRFLSFSRFPPLSRLLPLCKRRPKSDNSAPRVFLISFSPLSKRRPESDNSAPRVLFFAISANDAQNLTAVLHVYLFFFPLCKRRPKYTAHHDVFF